MPRKRFSTEQIVTKLRQAEVELGRGLPVPQVCKKLNISEQTYYRWRWENGYIESFNGKLRDELLDREIFYTLTEAKILIERWRREYNTVRPHGALGYRPPAPEAVKPAAIGELTMSFALS